MELFSIYDQDFNFSNTRGLYLYFNYLISEYNWRLGELQVIFDSLKKNRNPINPFCIKYLTSYLGANIENVTWKVIEEEKKIFSDNIRILEYSCDNKGPYYVVFDPESLNNFVGHIVSFELGAISIDGIPSIEELNNSPEFETNKEYLTLIGCIEGEIEEVLPAMSELDIDESSSRFSSAIGYERIQEKQIMLAGVGGIGSYVAFLLSRMKPDRIILFDDDIVETANMSGQLFSHQDVDKYKVTAISSMMSVYSLYDSVTSIRSKFKEDSPTTDIMICGFDSMAARKLYYKKWTCHVRDLPSEDRGKCLFIDGRLAAEELQVFCIKGDDYYNMERYSGEFLFSDEEADETVCSYKQTTFMANMIGSIIVNLFTNFVANEIVEDLRDLPFLTSYSAETMMLKTEN